MKRWSPQAEELFEDLKKHVRDWRAWGLAKHAAEARAGSCVTDLNLLEACRRSGRSDLQSWAQTLEG